MDPIATATSRAYILASHLLPQSSLPVTLAATSAENFNATIEILVPSHLDFISYENGVCEFIIRRPRAINALSYDMIKMMKRKLEQLKKDPSIKLVMVFGACQKGFSAGGDLKEFHSMGSQFCGLEYKLDALIHSLPFPYISFIHGYVMGGGAGVSMNGKYRVILSDPPLTLAMPEVDVGYFTDCGPSHFLNNLNLSNIYRYLEHARADKPSELFKLCNDNSKKNNLEDFHNYYNNSNHGDFREDGNTDQARDRIALARFLATTATYLNESEALLLGLGTHMLNLNYASINRLRWEFISMIINEGDDVRAKIEDRLKFFEKPFNSEKLESSFLVRYFHIIVHAFSASTVVEMESRLNSVKYDHGNDPASYILRSLQQRPPTSLKVTYELFRRSFGKSIEECLKIEYRLSVRFLKTHDLREGIRYLLIDKYGEPTWKPARLEEVTRDDIEKFFAPFSSDEQECELFSADDGILE